MRKSYFHVEVVVVIRFSYPLVRIAIYEKSLVVAYLWNRVLIEREDVLEIAEMRGLFGSVFTISHRKGEILPNLRIIPTNKEDFLAALIEAGYR